MIVYLMRCFVRSEAFLKDTKNATLPNFYLTTRRASSIVDLERLVSKINCKSSRPDPREVIVYSIHVRHSRRDWTETGTCDWRKPVRHNRHDRSGRWKLGVSDPCGGGRRS